MIRPSFRRDAEGAAAVEFALVATIFIVMLWGVMEFGFQLFIKASLDSAVIDAARCRALNVNSGGVNCTVVSGSPSLTSFVQGKAAGVPFSGGNLTVTAPTTKCVTYSYTSAWLVPGILEQSPPTLTGRSCFEY